MLNKCIFTSGPRHLNCTINAFYFFVNLPEFYILSVHSPGSGGEKKKKSADLQKKGLILPHLILQKYQ